MRLVRLAPEPTTVGADIRAAVSVWGRGVGVLGGVAVFGCTPPGCRRPVDAVLVLPRGIIVVAGADLPEPALELEAPLGTPWTVDGWPLVRSEGGINPALDAVESASALARSLQDRSAEPLPVTTIVAVGPFVEQVTQPTIDLHRGVRVVHPTTKSMLAAVRELATYERDCTVESARHLLRALDAHAELGVTELAEEGFPDAVTPDLASADTMLIAKVTDPSPGTRAVPDPAGPSRRRRTPRRGAFVGLVVALVLLLATIGLLALATGTPSTSSAPPSSVRVDGVVFTRESHDGGSDCSSRSFGDVQGWLRTHPCSRVTRSSFTTRVSGRAATVAVTELRLTADGAARDLQELLNTPEHGGLRPLAPEAAGLSPGQAARAVRCTGRTVRITLAAWARGSSAPEDVRLRALAERAMRLPV